MAGDEPTTEQDTEAVARLIGRGAVEAVRCEDDPSGLDQSDSSYVMNSRYDQHMRTTISLDDALGKAARRRAREQGLSLSAFVAMAVRALLTDQQQPRGQARPFRLVTVGGGGPHTGVDLDRTSALVVADDEAAYGDTGTRSR